MSTFATSRTEIRDIPKVGVTWYTPENYSKSAQLAFVSMRSHTYFHSVRPPKFYGRSDFDSRAKTCKEFSFEDIRKRGQSVLGFRKGKVFDHRSNILQCEDDSVLKGDIIKQKTQDFSISGQKVKLNIGDDICSHSVPPREWVIEKSRTLPEIRNSGINTPYTTPVKLFHPNKSPLMERLGVLSISPSPIDNHGKAEPISSSSEGIGQVLQINSMDKDTQAIQEDSRILPGINSSLDSPSQNLTGVTVSLQTDDYLYYGANNNGNTPIQGQHVRVKYQPMKTLTPKTLKKLPTLRGKKQLTSGEVITRKFQNIPKQVRSTNQDGYKKSVGNVFSSFPIIPNAKT